MENSQYFILALLGIAIQTSRAIADLREENTRLKLEILESDIHYDELDFAKMLNKLEGEEINWNQSGIGAKKRRIENLKFDVKRLKKKKRHFFIFFY